MKFGLASLQQRDQLVPWPSAKTNLQSNLKRSSHTLKAHSAESTTILKCGSCTGTRHNSSCLIIIPLLTFWMQKSTACWMTYSDKAAGMVTHVFPSRFDAHTQMPRCTQPELSALALPVLRTLCTVIVANDIFRLHVVSWPWIIQGSPKLLIL